MTRRCRTCPRHVTSRLGTCPDCTLRDVRAAAVNDNGAPLIERNPAAGIASMFAELAWSVQGAPW